MKFKNSSTGDNLKYLWDFGDGTTSSDFEPIHVFASERSYTIKLKVYDGTGCEDNMVKNSFVRIKIYTSIFQHHQPIKLALI
ncbi:MAG: PKD domain-containing protein [Saprospirales bacterium]|nr:PKD domain-containing protein [Saprospirales bacterium]